jgi:hypothetical protein
MTADDVKGPRRTTLLFSGGVDSTMAACKLAETYDAVDLVSYTNGYGHYKILRTAKRARELARHYPNVFTHQVLSVQELFEDLVLNSLDADYARFGSGFVWCMGCKIAMHVRTIIHNVEKGIYMVADGSSFATSEMVEQMPVSVARIKGFYCEYGITFENPVYTMEREASIQGLKDRGFRLGLRVGDRFLGTQPKCKPGELYYMPLLLLGREPAHDEKKIAAFIDEKLVGARRYIARHFDARGLHLEA